MRRFYPDMRRVAFISDNTYGGLSMQALVKKEMEKYPEFRDDLAGRSYGNLYGSE